MKVHSVYFRMQQWLRDCISLCRLLSAYFSCLFTDKMVIRYGAVPENEVDESESEHSFIFTKHRILIFGIILNLWLRSIIITLGIMLSVISGSLFTANNFIINQFQLVVSDVVLVRCVIQAFIFIFIMFWNGDTFFPERSSRKLLIFLQGIFIVPYCMSQYV